jgi:hypothetical protein
MSDDSNVTMPEPDASASTDPPSPDAESPAAESPAADATAPDAPAPEPRPAGRLSRMVPSWARRRPLLAGFGAGILAAAVIAGVSFEAVQPSGPPRGQYASLPKQPCAMISSAELAKYLPAPTCSSGRATR